MTVQLHSSFDAASRSVEPKARRKLKQRPPRSTASVTIRLSAEEKGELESEAGGRTLSAYVRTRLFGAKGKRGPDRRPSLDAAVLARLLGALGRSDLAASMREIALAARSGTLESGPALSAMVDQSCRDIAHMRRDLIRALGVQPE